jgi:hypothetical protein
MDPRQVTRYSTARAQIRDGDDALFRNGGLIRGTGQGQCTHAAKCFWYGSTLLLAEMREWYGGRIITLSSQVRKYPGRIDIYRPKCSPHAAHRSAELLARMAGHEYPWFNIVRLGVSRLPLVRLATGWNPNLDMAPTPFGAAMHCSQAVVWVERAEGKNEGFIPVPNKPDRLVAPEDIEFSGLHERTIVSLVPDEYEVAA